jgi:hypothetical protein
MFDKKKQKRKGFQAKQAYEGKQSLNLTFGLGLSQKYMSVNESI